METGWSKLLSYCLWVLLLLILYPLHSRNISVYTPGWLGFEYDRYFNIDTLFTIMIKSKLITLLYHAMHQT